MTDAEITLRFIKQRAAELQKLPRDRLRMLRGYTSALATVAALLEREIEEADRSARIRERLTPTKDTDR